MSIVIHHNQSCGTSRNVLEIIRKGGWDLYEHDLDLYEHDLDFNEHDLD